MIKKNQNFYDVEIEIDDEIYMATGLVVRYKDQSYGADADGNRGISCWITEDIIFDECLKMVDNKFVECEPTDALIKYIDEEV